MVAGTQGSGMYPEDNRIIIYSKVHRSTDGDTWEGPILAPDGQTME